MYWMIKYVMVARLRLQHPMGLALIHGIPGGNTQSITVNPTVTTTYTLTVTDNHNCSGNHPVIVTVNPLPVTKCRITCYNLSGNSGQSKHGSGGASYAWNHGNMTTQAVSVTPASLRLIP